MRFDRFARRKLFSRGMTLVTFAAIVIILVPLGAVIYEAATLGFHAFNGGFLTDRPAAGCSPRPGVTCAEGGIGPAIQGTFVLILIASVIAVPAGIGAAIFAVEYGGERTIARAISVIADVLAGVPSILAGVFVYAVLLQFDRALVFSYESGGLALGVLMLPIVVRTSEVALRTVPNSVREAALALGIPRWKSSLRIILASALPGVTTGALLAIARGAGESAPLLFTLGNSCAHGFEGVDQEGCAMPLWIFQGATSPYANWITLAWGTALVLILVILTLSVVSRFVLERMARRLRGG